MEAVAAWWRRRAASAAGSRASPWPPTTKGQYHLAITVGNRIRTTLTPMTFSKPVFNGLQWDFASDKHAMTLLLSRINEPNSPDYLPEGRTSNTNLFGGRLESQIGDFLVMGGTFVNAHHSVTQLDGFGSDIISGVLSEGQNFRTVTRIQVRIADDSPGDGSGGALFSSDLVIHDFDGGTVSASEIGFRPLVEGGLQRPGYLAADGDAIVVTYDFDDRTYSGPDPTEIERVEVELVVANDYRIEIASDRQTNADGTVVFLHLTTARGNVRDGSNQRVLRFDYGVPTANQIAGFTVQTTDLRGLDAYLEVNVNHRYRKYPNPHRERHRSARDRSLGWLLNVSRKDYPWFGLLEAFGMDPGYSTSFVTVEKHTSVPDYGNRFELYEFVEDNDDYDRYPDWRRKGSPAGDPDVFPGLDENNDRIWDFNQNDNEERQSLIPDWEEPFLRYFADRPEYLYGVDSNHNGTVDRFENDERPDYPYRRDQQGYNLYGGFHVGPDARLTLGRMEVEQLSDDRRNRAVYGQLAIDRDTAARGRFRLFQDLRRVRDTIRDDLLQWVQLPNGRGDLFPVVDPMAAQDTWVNTTWAGWQYRRASGLSLDNKVKWTWWRQTEDDLTLELRGQRPSSHFLGVINKAHYDLGLGGLVITPRWKSEWSRSAPVARDQPRRHELTELFMLVLRHPIMQTSFLEGGVEYELFRQLKDPVPAGASPSFRTLTTTVQVMNLSEYLGYRLTTTLGFEVSRRDLRFEPVTTRTRGYITIYAGIQE